MKFKNNHTGYDGASNGARFKSASGVNIPRSTFNETMEIKSSMNAADLVPIGFLEVLPGDTMDINLNAVIRATTPINPVMDSAFIDK
jgi:hypothetical protein